MGLHQWDGIRLQCLRHECEREGDWSSLMRERESGRRPLMCTSLVTAWGYITGTYFCLQRREEGLTAFVQSTLQPLQACKLEAQYKQKRFWSCNSLGVTGYIIGVELDLCMSIFSAHLVDTDTEVVGGSSRKLFTWQFSVGLRLHHWNIHAFSLSTRNGRRLKNFFGVMSVCSQLVRGTKQAA